MKYASLIRYLSLALVIVTLVASGPVFADEPTKTTSANTIEIKNFVYTPDTITIQAGATVTWINRDQDPHSIVGSNNAFRSDALDTGDKFTYTLSRQPVLILISVRSIRQMTGTVIVKP